MTMGGYTGKQIIVDLNTQKGEIEKIDREIFTRFLGGIGTNIYYLFKELEEGIDPLSPGNVFVIGVGPLVGSGLPGTDRVEISSKSPLSGGFGSANAGEHLGLGFKKAGFDQIILKGKSETPVFLFSTMIHLKYILRRAFGVLTLVKLLNKLNRTYKMTTSTY